MRVGRLRLLVVGISAGAAAVGAASVPASAATSPGYSGALIESMTSTGFVAVPTSQPNVRAAQARVSGQGNGTDAGWSGRGIAVVSATDEWAVGSFDDLQQRTHPAIEHYTGHGWQYISQPTAPVPSELSAVAAIAANDVWAVGWRSTNAGSSGVPHTFIEHWDGASWTVVPSPNPVPTGDDQLTTVAGSGPNDVWAAGIACRSSYVDCGQMLLHWNGTQWQAIANTLPGGCCPGPSSLSVDSSTDAWMVINAVQVAHWNGTNWTTVTLPLANSQSPSAVWARSPSDVWVVGGGGLLDHWNGTSWTSYQSPGTGVGYAAVVGTSTHNVYAVGGTINSADEEFTFAARWNGTSWSAVPSQSPTVIGYDPGSDRPGDHFYGVSGVPGTVVALGEQGFYFD